MATFFVGQRVVLVRGRDFVSRAVCHGMQGRVSGFGYWRRGEMGFVGRLQWDCDVLVKWDDHPGRVYYQNTLQLEPILPEGHAPSIYSFQELMDKCREGVVA